VNMDEILNVIDVNNKICKYIENIVVGTLFQALKLLNGVS